MDGELNHADVSLPPQLSQEFLAELSARHGDRNPPFTCSAGSLPPWRSHGLVAKVRRAAAESLRGMNFRPICPLESPDLCSEVRDAKCRVSPW